MHLSVIGYLTTAVRAFAIDSTLGDDVRTVLAGWNPDESFWLADALERDGEPVTWLRLDVRLVTWTPAGMAG